MSEHPILFSGEMVRAILYGRKTQTRRIVKPQLIPIIEASERVNGWPALELLEGDIECPYGDPGDLLWVRETWGMSFVSHVITKRDYKVGGTWGCPANPDLQACVVYLADGPIPPAPLGHETARACPSIFMPRWASRITLEVVSVRVERLQDISEADAMAEGVRCGIDCPDHRVAFGRLWDSINAKRTPWASNPWVWAVEFKELKT